MVNKTRTAVVGLVASATLVIGIATNEGFKSVAYKDSGNVWTLGYGETNGVKQGDTTTPVRALQRLGSSVDIYAKGVQNCISAPLFQYEFDAYVDVAYNVGVGAFCKSPMVVKVNALDYEGSCNAIRNWYIHDHDGHLLQGLVNQIGRAHV